LDLDVHHEQDSEPDLGLVWNLSFSAAAGMLAIPRPASASIAMLVLNFLIIGGLL